MTRTAPSFSSLTHECPSLVNRIASLQRDEWAAETGPYEQVPYRAATRHSGALEIAWSGAPAGGWLGWKGVELYAVRERRGGPWDWGRGLREQEGFDDHARFMDDLVEAGFVLLGGRRDG